jgi:hypothetical protein
MAKTQSKIPGRVSAQPHLHQRAAEIQPYGTVSHLLPLDLEEAVRLEMTAQLNQLLADTMTLRDLYKKSHWQVAGPTFYQLHLLFDKHFNEQEELVDSIAELFCLHPKGLNAPECTAIRPILKLANSWQIGFLREVPEKRKSENSRVFTGDLNGGPGWT